MDWQWTWKGARAVALIAVIDAVVLIGVVLAYASRIGLVVW